MDKANKLFPHSPNEATCPNHAFGETFSDPDLHIQDVRVARLLVLLQKLHESEERLGALPEFELTEIASSSVQVCGFVDPIEARGVIAAVVDALRDSP